MKILAAGDSFIWGSELADSPHCGATGYSRKTFPALLADTYHCTAYPGIGNREISRRAREALAREKNDIFVIVCWTWPSRDNQIDSDRIIQGLQEYLEQHKFQYLFTCADNCVVTGNLDYSNWFLFPAGTKHHETQEPRGFYQWAVENKYPVGLQHHPLEQAHEDAAKLIKEKINEMVEKHLEQNRSGNPLP